MIQVEARQTMRFQWFFLMMIVSVLVAGEGAAQGNRTTYLPLMARSHAGTSATLGTLSYGANLWVGQPQLSHDGQVMAVTSAADNLVAGDTNGDHDVFAWVAADYRWVRVSVSTEGVQGDNPSEALDISDDGRYVLFRSWANNLVVGDMNGVVDIFRHDLWTGRTELVSAAQDGTIGNGESWDGKLSRDGQEVAFTSFSTNLSTLPTEGENLWVRDMGTGGIVEIPTAAGALDNISVGGEARFVAYQVTEAIGDNCTGPVLYRYDRATATHREIARSVNGPRSGTTYNELILSGDGVWAGYSEDSYMYPGTFNFTRNFVRLDTGEQHEFPITGEARPERTTNGPDGGCYKDAEPPQHGMSADGSRLIYPGAHESETTQILLFDTALGETRFVSLPITETPFAPDGNASFPVLSGDGKVAAFISTAANLVGDADPNGDQRDLFVWHEGATLPLPRLPEELPRSASTLAPTGGQLINLTQASPTGSYFGMISTDGSAVVFTSHWDGFVGGTSVGFQHVYVWERATGVYTRASVASDGTLAEGDSQVKAITPDGRYILFSSNAANLDPRSIDGGRELFRHDRLTGETILASPDPSTSSLSESVAISPDGRYLLYARGGIVQSFLADIPMGTATLLPFLLAPGSANFSADGSQLFYGIYKTGWSTDSCPGNDLYEWNLATGARKVVRYGRVLIPFGIGHRTQHYMGVLAPDGTAAGVLTVRYESPRAYLTRGVQVREAGGGSYDLFYFQLQQNPCQFSDNVDMAADFDGRTWLFAVSDLAGAYPDLTQDTNGVVDVLRYDRLTQSYQLLSTPNLAAPTFSANGDSYRPSVTGDGGVAVFSSDASNLTAGDTNGAPDLFVWLGE